MAMGVQLGGENSEINITPLIDVLLVLVIIFMLLSQRMVIFTNVAREQSGGNNTGHAIVLELADDGRYLLNTRNVPGDSLVAVLREVFAVRNDKVLL